MTHARPLSIAVLLFELARTAAFLSVYSVSLQIMNLGVLPITAFFVPNILFVFMALFLFLDTDEYKAYIPLYVAGKILYSGTLLVWLILSFHDIINAFLMDMNGTAAALGLSVVSIPVDLLSALLVLGIKYRSKKSEEPEKGGL